MLAIFGLLGIAFAGTAFVFQMENDAPTDDGADSDGGEVTAANTQALIDGETPASVEGSNLLDEIFGDEQANTINAHGGDDYVDAEEGDDTISGGDGDDQLHGGIGDDDINGDAGDDQVFGHVGDDSLDGGAGNDRIHGGDGTDYLNGAYDDDELLGGAGDDHLIGGAGADVLQGSTGNDTLDGVTDEDQPEQDYLNGGVGADTLIGGAQDVLSGGDGADTFDIVTGGLTIMDLEADDLVILRYSGEPPELTLADYADGLTLLANGVPVADLFGVDSFDLSTVRLVAA